MTPGASYEPDITIKCMTCSMSHAVKYIEDGQRAADVKQKKTLQQNYCKCLIKWQCIQTCSMTDFATLQYRYCITEVPHRLEWPSTADSKVLRLWQLDHFVKYSEMLGNHFSGEFSHVTFCCEVILWTICRELQHRCCLTMNGIRTNHIQSTLINITADTHQASLSFVLVFSEACGSSRETLLQRWEATPPL